MTVYSFQSVRMANHQIIAVSTTFEITNTDFSVKCGTDRITDLNLQVNPLMHTATTRTIFGSNPCHSINGKYKCRTIYFTWIRHFYFGATTERINPTGIPIWAVQLVCGKHESFFTSQCFINTGIDFGQFFQTHIFTDSDAVSHQFGYAFVHFHYMYSLLWSIFPFRLCRNCRCHEGSTTNKK